MFSSNKMGSCVSTLTISPDLVLALKANPDKATLLSLQLHWHSYDKESQSIIDQLTQLSLGKDHHLEFVSGPAV
jgi:hypothetical protein